MSLNSNKKIILCCLVVFACVFGWYSVRRVLRELVNAKKCIEAYRVCNRFQTLLAENLDFDRAFEATFARNASRRREIAITEGEFDGDNLIWR